MKMPRVFLTALGFWAFFAGTTDARNVQLMVPIATALEAKDIPDRPTGSVKFFFGNQASPQILTKLESYVATPKTSAMGKSDQRACHEALLWTLVAMEKRAQQKGANAVVNIVSFYKKNEISSATEFECHVGNVIVSVVLKGDLVKTADQ
jgi:uncharacterized protein YbjQ (UPF0145 family)